MREIRLLSSMVTTLLGLILFISPAFGARFLTNSTVPLNITDACVNALLSDVNCSPAVPALQHGIYYPKAELDQICTADCATSLASYHSQIMRSCASDTWNGIDDDILPIAMISEIFRYHYNATCLTDGTRFCNNVAASYSVFLDPESSTYPGGLPAGGDYGGIEVTDPCDICLVKSLQFQAGSPYYNGLDLQESSIYQSKTSSCGIANAPLTTTALSIVTPTSNVPSVPTCAGISYTIQAGDDCHSISQSQSIGTSWLLADNDLTSACVDFPVSGSLCLVNTCTIYTIQMNDTCKTVSRAHNITETQFKSWNPSVNAGCYNLERMVGDQVCIAIPGTPYVAPPQATLAPSIPITAAPIPTDVAVGTNTRCGRYYKAILGDYCNLIVMKFGITIENFIFLNPAINSNCTNLFAEESYCVLPVGDINTYSGKAGYVSFTVSRTSIAGDPATGLPAVIWTSPTPTTTQLPIASDTRDDCNHYFRGDFFQDSIDGTHWKSTCELAAAVMDVTIEDLQTWNPILGNTTDACAFATDVRYCGRYYAGDLPYTGDETSPLPFRDGTTPNCTQYAEVTAEGGPDCETLLNTWDLSIAQFYKWNPTVGTDCSGLWAGYRYCVRSNEVIPTSTGGPSPTSTSISAPGPTQPGQPSNCNKWHVVTTGEDCAILENEYFITHAQFIGWNPAVSEDCRTGFWGTYAYCVGTTDTISSTRSVELPEPTAGPMTPPEPSQPNNAISTCNKFAQAQDGDWCALFAERNGVTLPNLYAWNAVLKSDGSGCDSSFWKDNWYCVGVSSTT
ncbi:LysM domain-containing protein [Phlyctema vagabunda]|uniref:LysM domain-containing protein n=1 Tax=Phlyctema vagabunda TaxID=108571 RepID=A0ABR4PLR1_9HELO